MVVGGFGQAMQGLAQQLGEALRLSTPVVKIEYSQPEQQQQQQQQQQSPQQDADQPGCDKPDKPGQPATVRLHSSSLSSGDDWQGEVLEASLVLVTLPLGWKAGVVRRMGFGDLNKVVLQGRCFMFWNLARFNGGAPLLAGLDSQEELVEHMLQALRRAYGGKVQQPLAALATRWASEEFSRGSYSYVAVGCSGDDYDALALPVARRLLFAGEHTCKEHPDTVGGAMLSGMREAARALQLLRGKGGDSDAGLVSSRTETLSRTDSARGRRRKTKLAGSPPMMKLRMRTLAASARSASRTGTGRRRRRKRRSGTRRRRRRSASARTRASREALAPMKRHSSRVLRFRAHAVSGGRPACCLRRLPAVPQRASSSGTTSRASGVACWMHSRAMLRL
ncbi:flavin-containing amine oxidoreductase-domain containing protein [Scenedesmus sp. NREL 46B-D3]|nr:flavin-containing amine oxidoreductase-domain containing protein [Scenedesmus sp. NREL 46B-D3]